jgi:hypothetical protein
MLDTLQTEVLRPPRRRINRLVILIAVLAVALIVGGLVTLKIVSSSDPGSFPQVRRALQPGRRRR